MAPPRRPGTVIGLDVGKSSHWACVATRDGEGSGEFGLYSDATAGLLAGSANVLALLGMVKFLKAKDKVICIAFAVCCAFLFGDHLSFTANFQPNLIVVVLLGKLSAGICAIVFCELASG